VEIAFDAYTRYLESHGFKGEEMARQQASFFCAFTELYLAPADRVHIW
jgi:hypothetical protein